MKLAITIYPESFSQADRVIHLLSQERSLELDGYMGKATYEKNFDKPRVVTRAASEPSVEEQEREEMNGGPSAAAAAAAAAPTTRTNITPGWEACSRINADTKKAILEYFGKGGRSMDAVACKRLKKTEEQLTSLLQLLWTRGEIKYDGNNFYTE